MHLVASVVYMHRTQVNVRRFVSRCSNIELELLVAGSRVKSSFTYFNYTCLVCVFSK